MTKSSHPSFFVGFQSSGSIGSYVFGFTGQEKVNEIYGEGNAYAFEYRIHDPRIGRFLSVDPLHSSFPWNTPYAYCENRVMDGIDLEGLEYICIHHFFDGTTSVVKFYLMTDEEVEQMGGTGRGFHNSVPYGPEGKGILHYYHNEHGDIYNHEWEQLQNGTTSSITFHGLYSGPGCITTDGLPGSTNYNFDEKPIDWADAIAKRHDMDYAAATGDSYSNYLEDVRTLQADKDMIKRIDDLIVTLYTPFKKNNVEGCETPVRKTWSREMWATLQSQRLMINALAVYKQWKIDNKVSDKVYKDNREAFKKDHPTITIILDQTKP